ncbi:hypothetical protein EI555_002465, partial [Monodon monoceros]
CGATCESCFSQDFCIQCKRRFYLYKGKCLPTCPPGTAAQQSTRECQEECELGPWGSWSPCTHNGKTCGSAWGLETRVREAGRAGREEAATCQVLSESRQCPIRRPCPGGEHQAGHGGQQQAGPRVALSGLGTQPPQRVAVRLPESPPLATPFCVLSIAPSGVLLLGMSSATTPRALVAESNPNQKKSGRDRRPRKDRKLDGRGEGRPRPAPA